MFYCDVGDDTLRGCPQNSASPICNCSFIKRYSDELNISCTDSTNNCTWFHKLNGSLVPIEEKFLTGDKNNITLLGYYDNESYGYFVAINSSGVSCYYLVTPPLNGMCNLHTFIKLYVIFVATCMCSVYVAAMCVDV